MGDEGRQNGWHGAREPDGPEAGRNTRLAVPHPLQLARGGFSYRLVTLGRIALLDGNGIPEPSLSTRRRKLALLAYLALASRPVPRAVLIDMFWGERDERRAGKSLSDALSHLRRVLGPDLLEKYAADVALRSAALPAIDVLELLAAATAGDHARVVELYTGPFLSGVFIDGSSTFEDWSARQRQRCDELFVASCAAECDRLALGADWSACAALADRWIRVQPVSRAAALHLVRALGEPGTREALVSARAAYLHHQDVLARDYELEPDGDVQLLALQIERALHTAPELQAPPTTIREETGSARAAPARAHAGAVSNTGWAPPRTVYRYAALLLVVVGVALAGLISRGRPPATPAAAAAQSAGPTVAVLPFAVHGDAAQLGAALAGLLSSALDAAGDLRTVDMHALVAAVHAQRAADMTPERAVRLAERFGATMFVLGDVVEAGNQVTVTAALYNAAAPGERIESIIATAPGDSVSALVDRLATTLLAALGDGPGFRLTRAAALTTGSFAAFKAYVQGEAEFQAGRYDRAAERFRRAVIADPKFALAHYRLSVAAEWSFDFLLARSAARAALDASERLSLKEGLLLRAWDAFLEGRHEEAERQYARILDTEPGNVEALSGHAEVLVHFNPVRGVPAADAQAGFARVLELAPSYGEARFHALEFAARDRDAMRYDSLLAQIDERNSQLLAWRAVRAFTWGDAAEQNRILAALDTGDELTIGIAAGRVAAHAHDFSGARRIVRLLTMPHRTREWRAGAHLVTAQLHLANGDWTSARRELDRAAPLERDWTIELFSLYLLHPYATASADDLEAARDRLLAWQPGATTPSRTFFFAAHADIHAILRSYLLGMISVRQGSADAAGQHRAELRRITRRGQAGLVAVALARSLQGHIARLNGTPGEAIHHLLAAAIVSEPERLALSPFYSRAHDRFVIAELYEAAGDTAAAAAWYGSLLEGFDYVYAAAAHERLASLLERENPDRAHMHRVAHQRLTRR